MLEIDIINYSDVNDYLPYKVPEIWLFRKDQLQLCQFQGNQYQRHQQSQFFPTTDLPQVISRCLQIAYDRNTSAAIRDLKQRLG